MKIRVITTPITCAEAKEIAQEFYKEMIKGVVDIEREIIALGGEWHMDANTLLMKQGSLQKDVWGFNFYPATRKIEYNSLINIRPAQGNMHSDIQDENLCREIKKIIDILIL